MPPPIDPGIHDKNSKPLKLFSHAKFDTFLSKIEQPAITTLFFVSDILLKFLPNLIKIRFWTLSDINKFEPAPIINKLLFSFFKYNKNSLSSLKVSGIKKSDMSFSVQNKTKGLEYSGSSLNHLFSQRKNLLNPSYYKFLMEINKFNQNAPKLLEGTRNEYLTIGEYIENSIKGCRQVWWL